MFLVTLQHTAEAEKLERVRPASCLKKDGPINNPHKAFPCFKRNREAAGSPDL